MIRRMKAGFSLRDISRPESERWNGSVVTMVVLESTTVEVDTPSLCA
jgi:hypothetical protein